MNFDLGPTSGVSEGVGACMQLLLEFRADQLVLSRATAAATPGMSNALCEVDGEQAFADARNEIRERLIEMASTAHERVFLRALAARLGGGDAVSRGPKRAPRFASRRRVPKPPRKP